MFRLSILGRIRKTVIDLAECGGAVGRRWGRARRLKASSGALIRAGLRG